MKRLFVVSIFICCALSSALSEPSDREIVALMNKVESRTASGDIKALDDLTSLPPKFSTGAFLTIFKNNNVKDSTPQMQAVAARCAQLATSTPAGEEYIVKLLKGRPANNYIFFQQESAIKCLVLVNNSTSVRILGGSLNDLDPDEIGPKVTYALATLRLPGAPVGPNERLRFSDALTKWKQWWETNRSKYSK